MNEKNIFKKANINTYNYKKPKEYFLNGKSIEDIIKEHELWIKTDKEQGTQALINNIDLHGIDLSNRNLFFADFNNCDLSQSNFQNTSFWGVNLQNCLLWKSDFSNSVLIDTKFNNSDLSLAILDNGIAWGADFTFTNFRETSIKNLDMSYCTLSNIKDFGYVAFSPKTILKYVNCTGDLLSNNLPMSKQWKYQNFLEAFKKNHKIWYYIWKITCKCGESISIWFLWNILIIIVLSLFLFFNPTWINIGNTNPFYYSIITFISFGNGSFLPTCLEGQILSIVTSVLGYISFAGLITIFSKKIAV